MRVWRSVFGDEELLWSAPEWTMLGRGVGLWRSRFPKVARIGPP